MVAGALNFLPSHQNWLKEFGWKLPGEAPSPILDMGEETGWRVAGVGGAVRLACHWYLCMPTRLAACLPVPVWAGWLGIVLVAPVHVILLRLQSFCALFYHLLS